MPIPEHLPTNGIQCHYPGMEIRDVLSANLKALMRFHGDRGEAHLASQKAVAKASGVGRGTVQRMEAGEVSIGIDVVESVAVAFGLQAWQMMVPGLDPANPPVVTVTEEEKRLWARIQYVQGQLAKDHVSEPRNSRLDSHSKSKVQSKKVR